MSDVEDEVPETTEEEVAPEPEPVPEAESHSETPAAPRPTTEFQLPTDASGGDEAKKAMEDAQRRKEQKQAEELAEYEASRAEEKKREEDEIRSLRERRKQRQIERAEEEQRLTEIRAQEDARRKAEDEVRKAKKAEEERKRREEREKKRKDAEERMAKSKMPNYVITKRSGGQSVGDSEQGEASKEEVQKSKEQLEEEKRAILAQRIQPLNISGFSVEKLVEKAKELHEQIRRLEGEKYDFGQRYQRQQYDMIELAERARQMNKGKRGVSTVQVDESFDRLTDKFAASGAPPKIQVCSKYDRLTDIRSYGERLTLFEDLAKPIPPPEIKRSQPVSEEQGEEGGEEEEA